MAPIRFGIHVCSISCANMRVRRGAATLEVAKLANAALRPVPPLEVEPAGASICNSVTRYGSVGSPQNSVSAVQVFESEIGSLEIRGNCPGSGEAFEDHRHGIGVVSLVRRGKDRRA